MSLKKPVSMFLSLSLFDTIKMPNQSLRGMGFYLWLDIIYLYVIYYIYRYIYIDMNTKCIKFEGISFFFSYLNDNVIRKVKLMYRFLVALICMLCLASILHPSLKARYRSRRDMKAGLEDHCDGSWAGTSWYSTHCCWYNIDIKVKHIIPCQTMIHENSG